MSGVAYFPWGMERIPEHLCALGVPLFKDDCSPELSDWYEETLRSGRRIHDGEPITAEELSFQPLAEVFP